MAHPQTPDTDWRNQEIKIDASLYKRAGGIRLIVVAVIIGFVLFPNEGYLINLYTTGLGVLITIAYLDGRAERREALRAEGDLKARLIREMGSQVNAVAVHAVEELRANRWLYDGSLKYKVFHYANLEKVELVRANLEGCDFSNANLKSTVLQNADLQNGNFENAHLEKSDLKSANFQEAHLNWAHLEQTDLYGANLQQADLFCGILRDANMKGVNLQKADLTNAILLGANLQHADLISCEFDESTVLPDGKTWTSDTDMTRFTDPTHPHFWRSDDPSSPAYHGNTGG